VRMNDTILRLRDAATHAATVELVPDRTARRVIAVAAFALATAFAAYVRVPVPFTPVPLTLQTMFVVLAGAMLGPRLGAASMLTYLGMGIAGLPVFAGGMGLAYLFGPTGGYLLAFPVAAFVAGVITRPAVGRGAVAAIRLVVGLAAAAMLILVSGAAWLTALTGDLAGAVALGIAPFLVGEAIKVSLAALIAWRGRDRTLGLL
jgi:biotin transport system substrate-specific component